MVWYHDLREELACVVSTLADVFVSLIEDDEQAEFRCQAGRCGCCGAMFLPLICNVCVV